MPSTGVVAAGRAEAEAEAGAAASAGMAAVARASAAAAASAGRRDRSEFFDLSIGEYLPLIADDQCAYGVRVISAALPAATDTVRLSPFTGTGVLVGAGSMPLDCTDCPPMVIPLVAVRLPAVRLTRLPETKSAPRSSCRVVEPLPAGSCTSSSTMVMVPSVCLTA